MMPGFWQIIIILLIVLILFGAGKLPQIMGDLGKGLRNFKDGVKGDNDDDKKDLPPPDNKGE
ncbi:MAG TPA: twin-arginine translocase TatA/TatE family subunit [Alphaproteobacteria bacterium]|jgi:sec-independent protein translocase protein TatA|nr:twin-arginine translocase TatA/TatE family subunit [Alphaproteobacteria bacterium]